LADWKEEVGSVVRFKTAHRSLTHDGAGGEEEEEEEGPNHADGAISSTF
jgi:hypothetical protein